MYIAQPKRAPIFYSPICFLVFFILNIFPGMVEAAIDPASMNYFTQKNEIYMGTQNGQDVSATISAAANMGANYMCAPAAQKDYTRLCGTPPDAKHPLYGGLNCPCFSTTAGFKTSGVCAAPFECKATAFQGLGGSMGDIGTLAQLGMQVGQIFQSLLGGGSGSGSGSGGTGFGSTGGSGVGSATGCASYYQVSAPSSDPCAYYVPPVSGSLGGTSDTGSNSVSDQLFQALGGSTNTFNNANTTVGNTDTGTNTNTNTNNTNLNADTANSIVVASTSALYTPSDTSISNGGILSGQGGISGNIVISDTGTTFYASSQDTQNNSATAGFYGSDTGGAQESSSVVGKLCVTRPWTGNFLSFIIPPSFFDSLCTWRGYKVGSSAAAPSSTAPKKTVKPTVVQPRPKPVQSTTTLPTIPPKVEIWAVPASVSIGTRTSIFWDTQGVTSCTETSPDGSFSQHSLSGGASTVPITGPTTFTISCITPQGAPVTDYVTVNIKI